MTPITNVLTSFSNALFMNPENDKSVEVYFPREKFQLFRAECFEYGEKFKTYEFTQANRIELYGPVRIIVRLKRD